MMIILSFWLFTGAMFAACVGSLPWFLILMVALVISIILW